MIQKSPFWVFIQKNWNQDLEEILALQYSVQPWRRKRQPTPVFLPGEFQGQRGLVGYSPWGRKESDRIEHSTSFSAALFTKAKIHKQPKRWMNK